MNGSNSTSELFFPRCLVPQHCPCFHTDRYGVRHFRSARHCCSHRISCQIGVVPYHSISAPTRVAFIVASGISHCWGIEVVRPRFGDTAVSVQLYFLPPLGFVEPRRVVSLPGEFALKSVTGTCVNCGDLLAN